MIQNSFPAMGTTIDVVVEHEEQLDRCRNLFERHERRFSRFRSNSELSMINEDRRSVLPVSPEMAEVLTLAQDLKARTGSLFDPAVGRAVSAWGYDRTFEEVTTLPERPEPIERGEWVINGRNLVRNPSISLDLGGIVKGWSADRAVTAGLALLISAGGDVRSAIEDAQVELIDPWNSVPATVTLGAGGLATSSVSRRRWTVGDENAHHIIDPTTMTPARSPILSATASCATAAEAEAAAKTILLKGVDGLAWADSQPWIHAGLVMWHDGSSFATTGWEFAA